jgi:hypothetical protein
MPTRTRSSPTPPGSAGEAEYRPGSLVIFEFTPDDLRANQRGYLTDGQRAWLRSTARGITGCSMASAPIALGFILLGLTLTLGMYLSNEDSRRALFSNPLNLVGLAAAGLIGVAAVGLSVFLARRQAAGVAQAQLRRAEGVVRLDSSFSPRSAITTYYVFVGAHKFSFGDDMRGVFREGSPYRVYYCQSGPYQLIMSFEEVGG